MAAHYAPRRVPLNRLHDRTAPRVADQMPDPPTAGASEQPQFPVAGLTDEEPQHRLRVFTRQPLRLGHARLTFPLLCGLRGVGTSKQVPLAAPAYAPLAPPARRPHPRRSYHRHGPAATTAAGSVVATGGLACRGFG